MSSTLIAFLQQQANPIKCHSARSSDGCRGRRNKVTSSGSADLSDFIFQAFGRSRCSFECFSSGREDSTSPLLCCKRYGGQSEQEDSIHQSRSLWGTSSVEGQCQSITIDMGDKFSRTISINHDRYGGQVQ